MAAVFGDDTVAVDTENVLFDAFDHDSDDDSDDDDNALKVGDEYGL